MTDHDPYAATNKEQVRLLREELKERSETWPNSTDPGERERALSTRYPPRRGGSTCRADGR